MNAGECKGGARAGGFRPERHQRKARVSSDRWEIGHWKREPSAGGARAGILRLGPHPCTRPHSCRRPGTAGAPAGAVKHIEAINLKRPAFALDHIHAGVPAWPVRPPLRQSYRG
ncbi:hypothetical protein NDU88_002110 [Pleurodeles waltl]|uniref:Uncharacterized protein n=1 Tax=Pleurodeles waltl TaxID=8319 RepID=A0AAV7LBE4_PLEWA|nr:hypothetical protein NDU88_002110 [Pleurodeles waltl]